MFLFVFYKERIDVLIIQNCNLRMVHFFAVTGLVCAVILKKLSKKAHNVKEQILSIDFEEHSKYIMA